MRPQRNEKELSVGSLTRLLGRWNSQVHKSLGGNKLIWFREQQEDRSWSRKEERKRMRLER